MSNVNLAEVASNTTYAVSLDQVRQLIADNLKVPVDVVEVHYQLASTDYDGPGHTPKYVAGLEVSVNNQALEKMRRAERFREQR
jgi:hypothetical protein